MSLQIPYGVAREGHKVVGLSDVHIALYDPKGLDVPALLKHRCAHGRLPDEATGSTSVVTEEELAAIVLPAPLPLLLLLPWWLSSNAPPIV